MDKIFSSFKKEKEKRIKEINDYEKIEKILKISISDDYHFKAIDTSSLSDYKIINVSLIDQVVNFINTYTEYDELNVMTNEIFILNTLKDQNKKEIIISVIKKRVGNNNNITSDDFGIIYSNNKIICQIGLYLEGSISVYHEGVYSYPNSYEPNRIFLINL